MISNILVPVDGSETTEHLIDVACALAKGFDAKITLTHVVSLPISTEPGFPIDATPLEEAGQKILESAKQKTEEKGCMVEDVLKTVVGNAGHGIVRISKERKIDLIVIGARGTSKMEALILGSVCGTVTHNAPCPVMVVR